MTTLLVGFDSAWTRTNSGALVGVLQLDDGTFRELGPPRVVDYPKAEDVILRWQADEVPTATIVLLDQPTIVKNAVGQRPVENIVGPAVGRRYGGMQPANISKEEMFGKEAPMWPFLTRFGGPADPLGPVAGTRVFETYPALAIIALRWTLPDSRATGRLPKYNPQRKKTFSNSDWQHVCQRASGAFRAFRKRGLMEIVGWIDGAARKTSPCKSDQDGLDACLCLLVALHLASRKDCLMVGNRQTGYIVVPCGAGLRAELEARCDQTGRAHSEWVRVFRLLDERAVTMGGREMRKKSNTVRYSAKQIKARIARGEDQTNWDKIDATTGSTLEASIRADVDDVRGEPDWTQAIVGIPARKDHINIRVDHDVLQWFRSNGKGYQTLMNNVLRAFVQMRQQRENTKSR